MNQYRVAQIRPSSICTIDSRTGDRMSDVDAEFSNVLATAAAAAAVASTFENSASTSDIRSPVRLSIVHMEVNKAGVGRF